MMVKNEWVRKLCGFVGLPRVGERGRKVGRKLGGVIREEKRGGGVQCKVRFAITSSGGDEGTR